VTGHSGRIEDQRRICGTSLFLGMLMYDLPPCGGTEAEVLGRRGMLADRRAIVSSHWKSGFTFEWPVIPIPAHMIPLPMCPRVMTFHDAVEEGQCGSGDFNHSNISGVIYWLPKSSP
jgi:hypothetical protein